MKGKKLEKGITLIALIITIIVLLILAVVAIGAVRDSGIIGHAQNSAYRYNTGKLEEESMIGQYEDAISQYETEGSFGTSEDGSDDIVEDDEDGDIVVNEPTLPVSYGKALNINKSDFSEALGLTFESIYQVGLAKLTYICNSAKIEISLNSATSFENFSVINVAYTDEEGKISNYAISDPADPWTLDEYKQIQVAYPYYPPGSWTKPSGEYYTSEVEGGSDFQAEIYRNLNADEFPEFIGNWILDEANSTTRGMELLSKVLVDLYEE